MIIIINRTFVRACLPFVVLKYKYDEHSDSDSRRRPTLADGDSDSLLWPTNDTSTTRTRMTRHVRSTTNANVRFGRRLEQPPLVAQFINTFGHTHTHTQLRVILIFRLRVR